MSQVIGQDFADLSGAWTLESTRIVDTTRIVLTETELHIDGPRGFFEGPAPRETYKLDGSTAVYVQDFGDWWRKYETHLRWDGTTLVMRLRVKAGRWDNRPPEAEQLDVPHGDTTRLLTLDATRTRMTVKTTVINGNPPPDRLTATQLFTRTSSK